MFQILSLRYTTEPWKGMGIKDVYFSKSSFWALFTSLFMSCIALLKWKECDTNSLKITVTIAIFSKIFWGGGEGKWSVALLCIIYVLLKLLVRYRLWLQYCDFSLNKRLSKENDTPKNKTMFYVNFMIINI